MVSENASALLSRLTQFFAAHQSSVFLVGGFLRDSLLDRTSYDIDLAVAGDAVSLGPELAQSLGGTLVPLSARHQVTRVVFNDFDHLQWNIDLAGFTGSIQDDLQRRDFTVNALALPLQSWADDDWQQGILDPVNGRRDITQKCIRAIGPRVFQEDPGRLLRAVRLASRLKFRLDPETASQIRADAALIERVSPERVRDELLAILAADGASGQLEVLDRLDLLCRVIPELAITKGVDQPNVHYWDVWGHSIHSVETAELVTKGHQNSAIYSLVPWTQAIDQHFEQTVSDGHTRRTILKLTALLHDIAKPQTKSQDATGRTRFLGHSEMGAEIAAARLSHLRLSSRAIAMVSQMVEQHLRPTNMRQGVDLPTNRAIYRYFRDLGDVAIDTLYLAMADYLAAKGPEVRPDDWGRHARMMAHILQVGAEQAKPDRPTRLLTGHDLMRGLKLSPGPQIGLLLEQINEAQAAGEINTQEEAWTLATNSLNSRDLQE